MSTQPTAQMRAGHIPADLLPPGADPRSVVIVQAAPPSYAGRALVVLAVSGGVALVIAMIAVTLHVAAAMVATLPAVGLGGATLKLGSKGGRK